MTQLEKLIKKFLVAPEKCHFRDIDRILIHYGFVKIGAKGSHIKYKHLKLDINYVVPIHDSDCKEFYKKEIKKIINKFK